MMMASARGSAFAMLMVVVVLVLARTSSAQCKDRIPGLIADCTRFVATIGPKIPPSQECCNVLKGADLKCLCNYVTPPIKDLISAEKALFVAAACGCELPPGFQCSAPPQHEFRSRLELHH